MKLKNYQSLTIGGARIWFAVVCGCVLVCGVWFAVVCGCVLVCGGSQAPALLSVVHASGLLSFVAVC